MQFHPTDLKGVYRIELEPHFDKRGFFARTFCRQEFAEHGLEGHIEQCNLVRNQVQGTLRGIHYHVAPLGEIKIVQCVRGAVYDVLVDLRPASSTYGRWVAFELREDRPEMLYVPKGMGHGYQTLESETYLTYFHSERAHPDAEKGITWNHPGLGIPWPLPHPILSDRDRSHPHFELQRDSGHTISQLGSDV